MIVCISENILAVAAWLGLKPLGVNSFRTPRLYFFVEVIPHTCEILVNF